MQMRDDLGKEASDCMNDYAMWSPQAYRELIRRLAERNMELEQSVENLTYEEVA